jgi:hypothetical protein
MNWPLVFKLSLFGLAMAILTVFVIPAAVEPICWLVIFIICALVIARKGAGHNFIHGLLLGIVNSVWITAAHVLFFDQYIAKHQSEAQAFANVPIAPRVMMAIVGPIVGVVSGVVIGILAVIAAKLLRTNPS